jgi:hypothetical protein
VGVLTFTKGHDRPLKDISLLLLLLCLEGSIFYWLHLFPCEAFHNAVSPRHQAMARSPHFAFLCASASSADAAFSRKCPRSFWNPTSNLADPLINEFSGAKETRLATKTSSGPRMRPTSWLRQDSSMKSPFAKGASSESRMRAFADTKTADLYTLPTSSTLN